jgi:hypothetical protein
MFPTSRYRPCAGAAPGPGGSCGGCARCAARSRPAIPPRCQDDQALLVKALTGQDVMLVCVDAAMAFRAREHGLTVVAMPTPDDVRARDGHAGPAS